MMTQPIVATLSDRIAFSAVTPDDFDDLVALRVAAMRDSLERLGRFDPERARERLRKSFYPEHTRFVILDGQRIGFYTFRPADDGFHLDHLYVHPSCQSCGVGSHVIRQLLSQADACGMGVRLGALRDSPSNRFYQRHGFVQTTEDEWDIYYIRPPQPNEPPPPVNEGQDNRLEVADGFFLSPHVRTDKAAYMEHFADPEIAQNLLALPFPYTEADADGWLNRCQQSANSQAKIFALREPSGYLIGSIGVVGALPAAAHSAEFGYWLAQSYRGRGLMPRVICTFADYAFQRLHLHRLYATPFTSNRASHRALEKAGFQHEGLLRHHHFKRGAYLDAMIYGRISESNGNAEPCAATLFPDEHP